MLKYKIKSRNDNSDTYYYYPEGNESAPGEIEIYHDGSAKILRASEADFESFYAGPALTRIDTTRDVGMIAIY